MRRVYVGENIFDAQLVCDRLRQAGIPAEVHGGLLAGAVGELPADTRPGVWIASDALYANARRVVEAFEADPPPEPDWRCGACGEHNGPAFEVCWSCGADRPRD